MAESMGRFKRITAEEAHQRLPSTPPTNPLREELTTLFAAMEPLEHYELALRPKERGVILRERIMRFAQENDIDGVHVRAGRKKGKKTIIVWRELRQQDRQGTKGENLEPPPSEAGQSIMASDTTPEEGQERLDHQP